MWITLDDGSQAQTPPSTSTPPLQTSLTEFSYTNLSVSFEWARDIWGNQGALGGCTPSFQLVGDIANVRVVTISFIVLGDMTNDYFERALSSETDRWKEIKENWDGGDPAFSGYVSGYGFPIEPHELAKMKTVLSFVIDADCNIVGYVLIPVTIPSQPS
jgi:hypothetical protein